MSTLSIDPRLNMYSISVGPLALSAFGILLILVTKLLIHILQLSIRLVNRSNLHASSGEPQEVI